jgi:TetR/AcrR family transcriptional repressor of nem operon
MPTIKIQKEDLLWKLLEVLHKRGYHQTSIQELSEATGLKKASLYHHFASKEQLVKEVMAYAIQWYREHILKVAEEVELPPWQRLEKLLKRQCKLAKHERRGCFFANMVLETGREDLFNEPITAMFKEWENTVGGLLSCKLSKTEAAIQSRRLLLEYEGAVMFFKMTNDEEYLDGFVQRAVSLISPPQPATD